MSPEVVRSKIRIAKRDRPIDLVVVDYLQLMVPPAGKRYQSREQEVASTSQALVAIAKECDVALILVCQLNRKCESRENKRPVKSDLRESGALEQDAYQILMVHRPCYYADEVKEDKKQEEQGKEDVAEIIVAKNKDGKTGVVPVRFNGPCVRFESMAPDWRKDDAK